MKRHGKPYLTLGLILSALVLPACKESSSEDPVTEKPKLVEPEPPTPVPKDCKDGQGYWSDAALVPLETQLRSRLPLENEYWLGTIENAVVCEVLRPSCDAVEALQDYFSLICPGEKARAYLDVNSESARQLQGICSQGELKMFHSCQEVLTERMLEKAFVSIPDRPRFYKLKSE